MSAAHAYDYEYGYVEAPVLKEPAQKKRRVKRRRTAKPVYVLTGERVHKVSALNLLTLAIIFAGCFGMLWSNVAVNESKATVRRLNQELKEIQQQVASLTDEVNVTLNLAEVEHIAINTLGMGKPEPDHIIHVDIPKQSYAVSNHTIEEETGVEISLKGFARLFGF